MQNEFKEGDLVRVVDAGNELTKGDLHVVNERIGERNFGFIGSTTGYVSLHSWNRKNNKDGFFPWRFKKVKAGELTPTEVYEYAKFKLKGKP